MVIKQQLNILNIVNYMGNNYYNSQFCNNVTNYLTRVLKILYWIQILYYNILSRASIVYLKFRLKMYFTLYTILNPIG